VIGLLQPALSGNDGNKYVQMLRLRIIGRFTDPSLQMQDLQEDMPINPDYLRRLFRQEHGVAPREYLIKLRLEHAAHLLRYEGASVSEAAFRSGFYDPLYFSRLFRRYKGISPSRWQNQ
jgi:AraC-like DNA-binding protein